MSIFYFTCIIIQIVSSLAAANQPACLKNSNKQVMNFDFLKKASFLAATICHLFGEFDILKILKINFPTNQTLHKLNQNKELPPKSILLQLKQFGLTVSSYHQSTLGSFPLSDLPKLESLTIQYQKQIQENEKQDFEKKCEDQQIDFYLL